MIPGTASKLSISIVTSADKISAKTDIVHVTVGAVTTINTIYPPFGTTTSAMVVLIPNGALTLGIGGNIAVGITALISRAVFLVYSKVTDKWYINSGV